MKDTNTSNQKGIDTSNQKDINTLNDQSEQTELEGNFDLVEFADVPEPMVASHIPMQED
jgi:hypothetical protein